MACDNIAKRYEGLLEVLNEGNIYYDVLDLDGISDSRIISNRINMELKTSDTDIIVALDEAILELALDEMEKLKLVRDNKIYGFGYTDRIVYNIEANIIDSVVVQNMYSVGYLGVKQAIGSINQRGVKKTIPIDSTVINGDNMYERDNQRWLFPIS